jgi:CheY-like chemotaxis protein
VSQRRILIVDDEPDVPELFKQRYRKELRTGLLSFEFAASAQEALVLLGERPELVLILSDINMPGMNGLELLGRIRALDGAPPVVMVTAYGDGGQRDRAFELGALDVVAKPIDFTVLTPLLLGGDA